MFYIIINIVHLHVHLNTPHGITNPNEHTWVSPVIAHHSCVYSNSRKYHLGTWGSSLAPDQTTLHTQHFIDSGLLNDCIPGYKLRPLSIRKYAVTWRIKKSSYRGLIQDININLARVRH
jgi:hypothetical protein